MIQRLKGIYKTDKTSLLVFATALACSRAMFFFTNDPEGPNLLIVTGMAVVIYSLSLTTYLFKSPAAGLKRLLLVVLAQILIVVGFYFCLNQGSKIIANGQQIY